jgi:hypothetical protein
MKDMTQEQARVEALRRWGTGGTIEFRPPRRPREARGRLARYACKVSNGGVRGSRTVEGQGDTWREAFEDARPR